MNKLSGAIAEEKTRNGILSTLAAAALAEPGD
jgi:hypothetical protein